MNFKKILGSILSTMSLFTAQSALAVDITNEATLNDYMTNKDNDKQTGVIQNDITTTAGITSSNSDVAFQASGNRVLSGELLRFTGANGKLTLSIVGGDTFTINNTISLDGTTLTNGNAGTYNLNNILGTGTLNLTSGAKFTANNVTASSLSIAKDTSLTLNDGTITTVQISGNSAALNVQNLLNSSSVTVSNSAILNVTDMYVSSTLVGNSNSKITAMKMVDGVNTGEITVEGEFSLGNASSAYADKVTANKVTLTSNSSLDLVGDDTTASKNGVLTVSDTLNIDNDSTVKANTVNAKTINSKGKIIIGKDGAEVSYVNTDAMTINKGDYTNTVIKGFSGDYSNISFSSGGKDINFNGKLNELRVKGGSTSADATVTINDDSKLKIAAGADESSKGVHFNGTIFKVGDNAELNVDAVSSDITFSSGNKATGITLGNGSVINVSSSEANVVTFDNINHDTNSNFGTLNITSGANAKTTAGIKGFQWVSGQIYLDKYIQNAGSTMTMLADSAINANVVTINGGKLALTGTSSTTTSDMSSVKDTIRAKTSFTAKQATITSSGLTQIISDGSMTFTDSGITVNSGSNSILSLSAKEGVNFGSTSHIILNGGELRIFGNNNVVNKISGSLDNAKDQKGTLRKVGSSALDLGTEGVKSSLNVDTVIIGEDKVFSGSADPVGSGLVTVQQLLNTEHFIVSGNSTVDVKIVKADEDDPNTLGSTNAGSEIRFKGTANEIEKDNGPVLNLRQGTLIADKIDLSVKEANLYGGVIGIEDGGTSKVIFGNKSKINVKTDNAIRIYVDNAAKGGFSAQGSEINLENKGSIVFGSAVGSQAHWNIKNKDVVQRFKAESWFDGIRLDYELVNGGIFHNKGNIIIGDYTNFGFDDGNHPLKLTGEDIGNHVKLAGGAIYNEGFFGSYTLEGTANDVKFINNSAASYIEEEKGGGVVVTNRLGSGGAIYNTKEGIIALGTKTKFDKNGAGQSGGAIYNDATDSTYTIDGKEVDYNAVTLGKDTWFTTNKAGRVGGAIYTRGGTISIGEKAAFDNNVVGFKLDSSDIERNDLFFHNAEGGALYVAKNSTVDIGAHSGMFNNFSSYSGGAISNHEGKLIFNDDGKIGDEPLRNDEIVKGSIRIESGGKRNETKNGVATGNIFYTHQGGGLFNENGEIYTRRTNLDGSTYLQSGLYNAEFNDNQALFGGAIYNYLSVDNESDKQLSIENSTFTGNSANRGIEIFYDATSGYSNLEETTSSGGAIYNAGHKVSYTLEDGASGKQKYVKKNVEYNYKDKNGLLKTHKNAQGKTVKNEATKIKVKNSTFTANTASNKAGAIYNDINTELELSDSTFNKNSATQGGAIYNSEGESVKNVEGETVYIGATIFTNLGEKGEKIIMNSNTATRQMSGKDETSPSNEFLGGAIYNAGTIKQKDSTSSYNNEVIGFEFNNNSAGAGQSTSDQAKSTIGRGGAYYNAVSGTTYVGNSKFDGNFTYAFAKDGEEVQSEGGAIYNEKGTLIIGESQDYDGTVKGVEFTNNGINANSEVTTNRGGAIYNATGATTIVESTKTKFSGNSAIKEGGAIYNATGATLEIKDGVSIGSIDDKANNAKLGGGVFNAGSLKLAEGTSFVNNTAFNGGGLYLKKGSTVNADAAGLNHLSKVTFEGNRADYGAGLFVDEDVDIFLDNVMFKGNSTSGLGSAFYNQGKLTLGENNTFFNNSGSLIGNSGELIFTKNFTIDGSKKGNEGNTSFITNEENGVVKITTENGTFLDINAIGDGTADGAAISLLGKSTITTDGVAKTLKNAIFTKNKGKNGGAIYKESTEDLTIGNTKFDGNNAVAKGGAIYNAKGSTVTIDADTKFTNNNANVAGGAIYNAEGGTLTFAKGYKGFANANSKNYSTGNGGAISNDGVMNIYYDDANPDSIIFSNQGKDLATGNGGALHLGSKSIVKTNDTSKTDSNRYEVGYIKNGVFSNNTANNGGALFNESNLVLEDTMFSGNKSGTAGGAIYNKGNVIDGRDYGILDIILSENKTLYNNKSDDKGGAIYNEGGTVNIIAKSGSTPTISGNTAHNQGGVVASEGGVINVGGNIKFKDNGTIAANSKGGVFSVSSGTLNLDTTDGDIVFDNNTAAIGSAIYVENGGKINFKGDDTHGITFSKTQTVASDSSSTNQMNVAGGNIKFESSLAGFTGQFTQTGGTFTLANDFMNLNGTHNEVTGGKFILSDGAKLMPTTDTEDNKLNINGATIRFENNDSSKLTDLSVLYQYKDTTKNSFSNAGSTLTYTSDKGDAKIGLSDAKLDLALTQKFVDVVDEQTGEKYRKNSGEYALILNGGADKNIDIAKDGRHAVSDLTVGDAVQIATDIKISNGGKLSLEGAGLSKDVKTIDLSNGGQLNIFNDTYEKTVDDVLTKYNTDLTFYGKLIGDATSKIYKGYKTSPLEDGLAGRASLIFASGASAADYMGSYIQNAGTLEFKEGSTYFNHLNSQVSYIEDAKLILNDGVIYTGNTTINFDGKGGKFVLGSATNIDMTHNPTPPPTNEKIEFEAKDKDGNTVRNTVKIGKDTTVQVTHGKTNVDASDEIINIGKNNAFSGIIVGGEENTAPDKSISIKVSTEGIEGKDTIFNVEDNGKLGFGDVKFVDSTGTDVTGTYSPTVKLGTNSEFYLVSGRDNDFSNLNLSTKATEWSKESGNLIKKNASKTTLTGAKTDLSGFHGTITIENGQIALGDDITEDKKFAEDTKFDLSKLANGASVIVDNITQNNDMTLINGIGNEIIGTPTGDEFYRLKITNDKGSIKFTKDGTKEYIPDIDVKNGSILAMEAKGDIVVGDVDVISKFSTISGVKQESVGGLKSDGLIKTGEIKVIGEKKGSEVAKAKLVLDAGGDIATGDSTTNDYKNITVKYGDLTATSTDGSITFGDATDTTNPALSVVNGSAYVVAKDALTMNGDVVLDSLTKNSLIEGSSVSMGSLTSTNNAERMIAIGATNEKLAITGEVTVDDTKLLQISGAKGIDIKATGTKKGDVTITDSKFAAIADTGNINIDGNVSADNSVVSIVVRDSGTGNITIGNNSTTTPALSVVDSSAYISSEGLTTIKGDVLMNNLADLAYISGNSVDIKGDVSIKNSEYASTIYAQDGNLTLGALDVVNNIDPNGKNVKTTIASNGGDIIAKGKLNVEDADIWVSANGAMKIASDTDGTGVAVKVKGGKAEIFSSEDMVINGDVDISEITDKSSIRGGSVSTGKINIHDNEKAMEIVSTVGNISTKDISVKDNNGELTNIQAKGGITTNNGNVDVANSNLQLIAQDGDVNLGTGTITVDNSTTIISATNGGITSGNIKVSDTAAGNIPTELGMAAKDGSISSGNIDLSSNVSLKQITTKTTGSTAATDITNGNIKIADNAKYQANSAGNYTAGDIIANVAEGSESIAQILADGNITIQDITAANLADMFIRSKDGDIKAGALTLDKVAIKTIDSDTHASVILAENGAITVKDITLTDMATNPTYIQAKNDLSSGSISLKKADANIISTDGNVTASGNVKADTSNIIMSAGGALTFGDASDLTNPALKVNDGSAKISAKNDILANGNIDVSKADLIIHSEEGGVTLGEETDLTNPALKVANGSAKISADDGALIIKGDVDMTAITADALMQGKSVAMENLKLYDNTKDSVINATEGDVSIKSITLTNNKETVDGKTTNKTITINATDGSINVDKDIIVSSSNLNMLADNGIKGNNLTVSDSVSGDSSNPTFGTILNAENGDVALNKISVNNAMAAIQSSAGNVNIKDSLTVTTDSETESRAYVIAENGKVSIGEGVTSSTSGVDTGIISAGENSNVTVVGNDVKLGNATTKTAINAGINSTVQIQSINNVDAANTKVVAMGSTVGIYGAEGNVSIDGITSQMSKVAVNAGKKLNVKGSVNSTGSLLSLIGLEETHIGGSVTATDSSSTIGSNGDVTFDKNVSFKNTVLTSGNSNVDLQVGPISTALTASGTSTTSNETTEANNDTPNLDVNKLIGTIQGKVKDIEEYNSTIEGKNVTVKGSLNATNDLLAIGRGHAVEKLAVNGDTTLDNSVVMINSSGDVVTNGLKAKDAFVFINAKDIKAKDIDTSVSDSSKFISYLETANEKFAVDNNMTMKNTVLNSKYTTNIAVGGAGDFNTTVLNIPNANAQFGSLKTENTMVSLQNNQANNTISVTGDYTVAGDNLFYMDFDPATGAYDRVHVGGAITGADGATITVNSNLVNKGDVANGYQIYDVFQGNNGVSGVSFGLQGETAYSTALANYQMESLGSGKYAFRRTGYTPTALVNPVAVQLGGFLTQVQTYDTAFDNLDMVMMLPMTAYGPNRYAVEDEEAMVYSPLFIPELEKGVWFRPFANFENVDMHQVGGKVDSQTYGALVGGDTALKDLGNGYQGMMSAYVGYTGAHQDLDGVSNYQNGGVVGVTGAIYKNGFFSGLTVSANASGNSASTPYGSNDFFMLSAGAASKTGYNWELANGRFIIQPSWLMSYTFANVFDPNDIAGMKVDSSALHAVQLAPGLKFIGNFSNGWQPYLTVDYRFNICDDADYKVGVVDLPDARVKSYIEYGLGMQKRWGDRFTGYGQFLGRGIGRNGVGLNLGMRWMVGDGRNPR